MTFSVCLTECELLEVAYYLPGKPIEDMNEVDLLSGYRLGRDKRERWRRQVLEMNRYRKQIIHYKLLIGALTLSAYYSDANARKYATERRGHDVLGDARAIYAVSLQLLRGENGRRVVH